jgi:hypothetical protein
VFGSVTERNPRPHILGEYDIHPNAVQEIITKWNRRSDLSSAREGDDDLAKIEDAMYTVLCESNGLSDNTWVVDGKVFKPEFPVTGFRKILSDLEAAWLLVQEMRKSKAALRPAPIEGELLEDLDTLLWWVDQAIANLKNWPRAHKFKEFSDMDNVDWGINREVINKLDKAMNAVKSRRKAITSAAEGAK